MCRSTAACLAVVAPKARPGLDLWRRNAADIVEGRGSTWNAEVEDASVRALEVEGEGRSGLAAPASRLDCGNSGTSMRLLAGLLAAAPFRTELSGDESLSGRPMERVAAPLRMMGADVSTTGGHAPITIDGGGSGGSPTRPPCPPHR